MMAWRWFFVCIVPYLLFSCSNHQASNQQNDSLMFFAAASTTDAVENIVEKYQAETGVTVRTNFAASSTLATQIDLGANADVYLSANEKWADYLEEQEMVNERKDILSNRLVLIAPEESETEITSPKDLKSKSMQRLSLADPEMVPAGMYAKQALVSLKLWEKVSSKVVRAADVRQALMFVEQGEAEAGIVYSTDAAITDQVRVVYTFEEGLSKPIRYPLVLLNESKENSQAHEFYQYLLSRKAKIIFEQYGFTWLAND